MKILVVNFSYGLGTPSGICNQRTVELLADSGHEIIVVKGVGVSMNNHRNINIITCSPRPLKPARLYKFFGNIIQRDIVNFFWEYRATRKCHEICDNWSPDVIYGRGSPVSGMMVGYQAATYSSLPLLVHFADPIPATEDWLKGNLDRKKMIRTVRPMLDYANRISFVTKEMMHYQQQTTNVDISSKGFVAPNPIPPWTALGTPPSKAIFLYLGTFFGGRNPAALIEGFQQLLQEFPFAELHLVGTDSGNVAPFLKSDIIRKAVKILPRTNDIFKAMKKANVLIDVDGNYRHPVFLSSKLMEYLSVDRFILSITPLNSPAAHLLGKISESSCISPHEPACVAKSMKRMLDFKWNKEKFDRRKKDLNWYTAGNVLKINEKGLKDCTEVV